MDLDVDRQFTDPLPNSIELSLVDPLSGRRIGRVVFDSDDELSSSAVREADAVAASSEKSP